MRREYKGVTAGLPTLLVKPPGADDSGDSLITKAEVVDYTDWGGSTVGLGPISIYHAISEVLPFGWPQK